MRSNTLLALCSAAAVLGISGSATAAAAGPRHDRAGHPAAAGAAHARRPDAASARGAVRRRAAGRGPHADRTATSPLRRPSGPFLLAHAVRTRTGLDQGAAPWGRLVTAPRRARRHGAAGHLAARFHRQAPAPAVWLALRRCESGDNYTIDTGNGFYGAYQFVPTTWWAIGYSGMPDAAPPPVQDQAARTLQLRVGWSAWPVCAARLGLG